MEIFTNLWSLLPKPVSELLPMQLEQIGVMNELLRNYVTGEKRELVLNNTRGFACFTLVDPMWMMRVCFVKSFGPGAVIHNWDTTLRGKNNKPGRAKIIYDFKSQCVVDKQYFEGDAEDNTLTPLYRESELAAAFQTGTALGGNSFPGLKIGPTCDPVLYEPEAFYLYAIRKIWGPYFQRFPFDPIYLFGKNWAGNEVVELMEQMTGRRVIRENHPSKLGQLRNGR
jgi:hypothetical protein